MNLVIDELPDGERRFELNDGGRCVGYATTIDRGFEVWLLEIAVHPQRRRRGLGTRLLTGVLEYHRGRVVALSCTPFRSPMWPRSRKASGLPAEVLAVWYARNGFHAEPEDLPSRMVLASAA